MDFDYYVCFNAKNFDEEFLASIVNDMGALKALFVYIKENDQIGIDVIRIDDSAWAVREVYYDSGCWILHEGSARTVVESFVQVINMHLMDSYDEEVNQ